MNMNDSKKRQRKAASEACIYPMTHRSMGAFFYVMITRNGKVFQKKFFKRRHGGHDEALKLATTWRDQVILENPARTRSNFCSILRSTNTSGVAGVARRSAEHVARSGKVTIYEYWQAQFLTLEGQVRRKNFSVSRYGEEQARELAIAARLDALALLANSVFRPRVQPAVVSSQEDIESLYEDSEARQARRTALLEERRRRQAAREKAALERQGRAEEEERQRLARPTNRTGHPYIGRYGPPSSSPHWRVSLEVQGKRYRKTFSDAVHGGEAGALQAAIVWRDDVFCKVKLPAEATRLAARATLPGVDADHLEGVARREGDNPGASAYWIAYAPKQYGRPRKSRKFSIAKHGADQAYALAIQARGKFVEEAAARTAGLHLVARKLMSSLGGPLPFPLPAGMNNDGQEKSRPSQ